MTTPERYWPPHPCQECGHDRQTHRPADRCWERVRFDDGIVLAYMGLCPCEGFTSEAAPCLCGAPSAPGSETCLEPDCAVSGATPEKVSNA